MGAWSSGCAGRIFPANALDARFIRCASCSLQSLLQHGNLPGVIQIMLDRAVQHYIQRMIFARSDFVQLVLRKVSHGGAKSRAAIPQMRERALPGDFRRLPDGRPIHFGAAYARRTYGALPHDRVPCGDVIYYLPDELRAAYGMLRGIRGGYSV